jgi:hypothetical protein
MTRRYTRALGSDDWRKKMKTESEIKEKLSYYKGLLDGLNQQSVKQKETVEAETWVTALGWVLTGTKTADYPSDLSA